MIRLAEVTEDNWMEAASLSVGEDQQKYVAPAIGILARGYVYRDCNARVFVVENNETTETIQTRLKNGPLLSDLHKPEPPRRSYQYHRIHQKQYHQAEYSAGYTALSQDEGPWYDKYEPNKPDCSSRLLHRLHTVL